MLKYIKAAAQLYHERGFRVRHIDADLEFDPIKDDILPIRLETVAKDDHVGDIERNIRNIKEGIRGTVQSLPFKKFPRVMINYLVNDKIKPKSFLPATDGISLNISPLTIVLGRGPPDYNEMHIEYGAYAQIFEDNAITNTPDARTWGAIALASFPDENKKYPFMNLNTGRVLWRRKFTELPITDLVIQQVHALATHDKQRTIIGGYPLFEWRPGHGIDDPPAPDNVVEPTATTDPLLPEEDNTADDSEPLQTTANEENLIALPPPIDLPDDYTSSFAPLPHAPPTPDLVHDSQSDSSVHTDTDDPPIIWMTKGVTTLTMAITMTKAMTFKGAMTPPKPLRIQGATSFPHRQGTMIHPLMTLTAIHIVIITILDEDVRLLNID